MSRMIILTEADLRSVVTLDVDAIACVEDAFQALATKHVAMPPILRLDISEHRGEVDVKTPIYLASTGSPSRSAPASSTIRRLVCRAPMA